MKAEWKKSPLERAKRKEPRQDAAQRIAELEERVRLLRFERDNEKRMRDQMMEVAQRMEMQRDQALERAHLFDLACHLELMVADKDGFKLLKGKELEEYCKDRAHLNASKRYKSALARSLQQSKEAVLNSILNANMYNYVVNPRSQS